MMFRLSTLRVWCLGLLGLWVSSSGLVMAATTATFVVSPDGDDRNPGTEAAPFRSILRAQQALRPGIEQMTSDVTILLRGGTYELDETLRFDHRDSGANGFRVVYRSFPGEEAIVSGGSAITGWMETETGLLRAEVGGRRFRQLYVNGARATRSRLPNDPEFTRLVRWDEPTQRLVLKPGALSPWSNLSEIELVVFKQWTQNNLRLESYVEAGEEVFLLPREPDRTKAFMGHLFLRLEGQPYFLENAFEFLDAPGEWYLRRTTGEVFYRPREGDDVARGTVIAPHLERLLDVRGTAREPVHDLAFVGLTFQYAGWTLPSDEGFVTGQADAIYAGTTPMAGRVPAAVQVEHAHHVRFERNTFRHLGGTGLTLTTGVSDSEVVGNRVQDLSGSGIVVESSLEPRPIDPRLVCRDNLVANNLIERIGLDYRSSVGIFAGFVSHTRIEHNEIHDAPYTGISLGWGWTDSETRLGHNRVAANHLYGVMSIMADGAGIYTLSKQPGTVIRENYIHDLVRSPWAGHSPIPGIYLDEGSSGILLSNNVLERVPLGILFHRASHNHVVNTEGTYEEHNGAEDNEIRQEPGFLAEAVKAAAGLEAAYADLRRSH